jgi:hypothetical protein
VTASVSPAQVQQSVGAATQALSQLEASLRGGGFAEGAAAYQRMAEVLVAQRLFCDSEDATLAADFDRLGATARRVFELLDPYAGAMRRLATLAPQQVDETAIDAVREQLARRGRRGMSLSLLVRSTKLTRVQVEEAVAHLMEVGEVVARASGDSASYRLADPRRLSERRHP